MTFLTTALFTVSAHWAYTVSKSLCLYVVCACVPSRKPRFPEAARLLVKERIANICIPLDVFRFFLFDNFSVSRGRVSGFLLLTLVTGDRWHGTRDMWNVTHDKWFFSFLSFLFLFVRFSIGATIRTCQET